MASVITEWITSPRAGRGIYLAEDTGGWRFHDYPELAASARRVGAGLRRAGVGRGDVVCVIMPTSFEVNIQAPGLGVAASDRGYVPAMGAMLPVWLGVACGMIAGHV